MASSGWRCCPCCRRALEPPVHDLPVHDLPVRDLPVHDLPVSVTPVRDLPVHDLPVSVTPVSVVNGGGPLTDIHISTRKGDIRRMVILGKTGAGKSSLANTILGEEVFEVCYSFVSGTKRCLPVTRTVKGRDIQLIDTPGFFDTDTNTDEFKEQILKTIIDSTPGIHSFLVLLKVERYTQQEKAVVDEIVKYFTAEALKYTTVVFTHGDDLQPEGIRIEDWLNNNVGLRDLVQMCGGRCHVFDNRYWNNSKHPYRNNQVQLDLLLKTIEDTVEKNGGRHYSNDLLKSVYDKLQEEKERIRKDKPTLTEEDLFKQAREIIYTYLWNQLTGYGGNLLAALLGRVADRIVSTLMGSVMKMLGL